jgi:uncharacterized protein (TIGR02466 family)
MYRSFSEFLFPKQIIVSDSNNFLSYRNELIKLCYKQKDIDPVGVKYSNGGGWQSKSDYILNSDEFNFFIEDLNQNLNHCLYEQFRILEGKKLSIGNCWINISKTHDYNLSHIHPLSILSGVFYIKCPPNCGNIIFEQDSNDVLDLDYREDEIKKMTNMYSAYYHTPIEGRMLLFPSNLRHYVESNKSDDDRISISFNIN